MNCPASSDSRETQPDFAYLDFSAAAAPKPSRRTRVQARSKRRHDIDALIEKLLVVHLLSLPLPNFLAAHEQKLLHALFEERVYTLGSLLIVRNFDIDCGCIIHKKVLQ